MNDLEYHQWEQLFNESLNIFKENDKTEVFNRLRMIIDRSLVQMTSLFQGRP